METPAPAVGGTAESVASDVGSLGAAHVLAVGEGAAVNIGGSCGDKRTIREPAPHLSWSSYSDAPAVLVAVVAANVASWRALEKAGFEVTSFSPGISVGSGGVASPLELHRMEAVLGEPSVVGLTNGHASLPDIGSAGRAARLSRYAGSAPCAPVFQFAGILEHIRDLGAC